MRKPMLRAICFLALSILMGSAVVRADVIYTFSQGNQFAFTLDQPTFITSSTTFPLSDFAAFTNNSGNTVLLVEFDLISGGGFSIFVDTTGGQVGDFFLTPLAGVGTYCSGVNGCTGAHDATLVVSQAGQVPEPSSLFLIGAGLATLLGRRTLIRK